MAVGISTNSSYEDEAAPLSEINVTPLVDVTLVLLIVFMITVPAIVGTAPVKVELPDSTAIAPEPEPTAVVFTLKRGELGDVQLYLNDARVDEAGVERYFAGLGNAVAQQQVSLSAGKGLLWDDVVAVIDLLKSQGVENLRLNTRHVDVQ
ncbi:MAG: ExbD/TolR family protein [Pirellulales bacterium]